MYTVLRITTDAEHRDALLQLGEQMNQKRAGVFSELRKAGDGFSCEVSSSPSWETHVEALHAFLQDFAATIAQARQMGAAVTVDVAIEPEDRSASGALLVLAVSPFLLAEMAALGLRWELSVY
jgi:hypothetical protein